MANKEIKIRFTRDYAPRKKGEVKSLETQLAEFYLNNGVAELAELSAKDKGGCQGCNEVETLKAELETANKKIAELLKTAKPEIKKAAPKN